MSLAGEGGGERAKGRGGEERGGGADACACACAALGRCIRPGSRPAPGMRPGRRPALGLGPPASPVAHLPPPSMPSFTSPPQLAAQAMSQNTNTHQPKDDQFSVRSSLSLSLSSACRDERSERPADAAPSLAWASSDPPPPGRSSPRGPIRWPPTRPPRRTPLANPRPFRSARSSWADERRRRPTTPRRTRP